jgi:hypothetical protein
MVLQIIHLILLTATLTCSLVVAFYAQRIHATQARELAFLDARDIGKRRDRSEACHARKAWTEELRAWLGDTGALLEKLSAIAEKSRPEARDTHLTPPPLPPPSSSSALTRDTSPTPGTAPVSRERMSPGAPLPSAYRPVAPPASARTMLSMPSARDPARARPTPRIETKAICRECDAGFVAVGNGGVGPCYACNGSGFIDAR